MLLLVLLMLLLSEKNDLANVKVRFWWHRQCGNDKWNIDRDECCVWKRTCLKRLTINLDNCSEFKIWMNFSWCFYPNFVITSIFHGNLKFKLKWYFYWFLVSESRFGWTHNQCVSMNQIMLCVISINESANICNELRAVSHHVNSIDVGRWDSIHFSSSFMTCDGVGDAPKGRMYTSNSMSFIKKIISIPQRLDK